MTRFVPAFGPNRALCASLPVAVVLVLFGLLLSIAPAAFAQDDERVMLHPFDYPQSNDAPDAVFAAIEIPAGGFTKYEIDEDTGHVVVDRFVRMPVAYPANYGSITRSLGGDDDPLDILVITRTPLHPGVIIEARPIAILKTVDGGEIDDKIVAVPVSKLDPTYDEIREIDDLPALQKQQIEAFFRVYKQLRSDKKIEIKGWANATEAKKMIQRALDAYAARHGG